MFGDPVSNPMGWKKKNLKDVVTDDCSISYGIVQTGENKRLERLKDPRMFVYLVHETKLQD